MKKKSKAIGKDYKSLELNHCLDRFDYYGIILKDDRVKVDTKRYKKFFNIPNNKIEHRKSVYYTPSQIQRSDYKCNWFRDLLSEYEKTWNLEYKSIIDSIKTPKQAEDNARLSYLCDGSCDIDEVNEKSTIAYVKRNERYKRVIKSLYAQFFHELMSNVDALCLRLLTSCGYKRDDYNKRDFDVFIQGLQGKNAVAFKDYVNYSIYDKACTVWNFLKHNSIKSYNEVKRRYSDIIWDPEEKYQNGQPALTVLKFDEKFLIYCMQNLHLFFDELCNKTFQENAEDAQWDYDDYFRDIVEERINEITNPLNL